MSKDKKQNKIQVDQESLRGYLKELSKEPHIAAGRRDKWAGIWIDMEWNQTGCVICGVNTKDKMLLLKINWAPIQGVGQVDEGRVGSGRDWDGIIVAIITIIAKQTYHMQYHHQLHDVHPPHQIVMNIY